MAGDELKYTPGDWVVHCNYGVGQIRATERKNIGNTEKKYFRIEMLESTIWVPVEQMDGGELRPVSTVAEFQEAIDALSQEPEELSSNLGQRTKQIKDVIADNMPASTAQLVRDLWVRKQSIGTLNQTERRFYRFLSDRLLQEWAVCKGIRIADARRLLDQLLHNGQLSDERATPNDVKRRLNEQDRSLETLIKKPKLLA